MEYFRTQGEAAHYAAELSDDTVRFEAIPNPCASERDRHRHAQGRTWTIDCVNPEDAAPTESASIPGLGLGR